MKKRVISFILALAMVCSLLPGATIGAAAAEADSYTYNSYTAILAENWNPHSWSTADDGAILDLLTTPLVEMVVADSENGVYQWAYLAAEAITDVTAQHQDDLDKYGSSGGNVFEIALNPDMKWQDGTPINADTYVYSMERLLNPDLQNPRANTYFSGEAAIAGAYNYFHSNMEGYYVPYTDVYGSLADAIADTQVYLDLWYIWGAEGYIDAQGNTCPQYVPITDETVYSADGEGSDAISGADLYQGYTDYFEVGGSLTQYAVIYQANPNMGAGYDTVGLYKVDDYTIRYVTQNAIDINYLRYSLTSNWLVYEELYETGSYGTGMANTMSYGPYQLSQLSATQMILTQNPNHYEYTVNSDGSLSSVTEFLVDGKQVNQWQAQTYVIKIMDTDGAKAAFLNGQLDNWTPISTDRNAVAASDRLYKADETYSMSFFMNTNLSALKGMDSGAGNRYSVVMSNDNFRKAFSLAIDRSDWVTVTPGYKPAITLMNNLYYYDIYNDPTSSYRASKQAMAAMCDLYGVSYTDETLADAYASLTGYDPAQAKALMAQACDELVEAGLYTEGEDITIHIAYTSATVSASHEAQIAKLNGYLNAAAEGSGFGTITLVADGGTNPYFAISDGTHAIGFGGWGGAAFYPFRYMQIYCAPNIYDINEGHCWDPATEELTLTVNGEAVTMTWQDWSLSCTDGAYRDADFDTKLTITAALEAGFLGKYYRIPLGFSSSCTMLSPKVDYYTNNYNGMYGFGGLRLMQFNYTDAQWAEYVASGELDYGISSETPTEPTEPTEPSTPTEPDAPEEAPELTGDRTFNTYTAMLAENWNPHTWSSDDDGAILDLLTTPLVEMAVADSENGVYQWAYLAAESITDVTAQHQDDLDKYGSTGGNVFEIALNPDMKWQDGTPINADTYVYSMERLLNPGLQNPRANTYFGGEAAIAGAKAYYFSGSTEWEDLQGSISMDNLVADENGAYRTSDGSEVRFALTSDLAWLGGAPLNDYVEAYGDAYFNTEAYAALYALADENGNVAVTDESIALMADVISNSNWGEDPSFVHNYLVIGRTYPEATYDVVGLYKVDDYTIRYVTQNAIDINNLRYSLTGNWLVYEDLYETGSYGTDMTNTMSYGPYQLSYLSATQMILTQNPNHYEYTVSEDGSLSSVTEFLVDGQQVNQWQTQNYVITVMDYDASKAAFLNGQLDNWSPNSGDLEALGASDRLYKAEETFSMSFFMNTNQSALKEMDNNAESGNQNSAVLSNDSFRKAFSLAIDRSDWVTVTPGYKPAIGLMNNLYHYDIFNDPTSSYRASKQAMAAMCDLYGVSYTDETLADAYASITGYDPAQAKALMAQACDELVEAGLYTEGEDITIHIAYTSASVSAAHETQVSKLNSYLNAAAEGSGFGTITLVADGKNNPYNAVGDGTHAIGYGAWGGAPFSPFRYMQIYCAPNAYMINEGHCWDPATEELTLTVNGEEVTMTWQDWSYSCTDGAYKDADFDTKLTITAALEAGFLGKYYRIPLGYSSSCTMLSPKVDYYTEDYNIMYGFGGLRLMRYNYTNSQWDEYVASGELDYGISTEPDAPIQDTAFVGNSLSLNGDIGVNFYTVLSDEFLADENAHIEFTVNGITRGYGMDYALTSPDDEGNIRYRFSQAMPAKGMADTITAWLCVSNGYVCGTSYSVAQYYRDICSAFSREEKPELFAMIEAMLNYGAAAQEYFDYNTDNLANAEVATAVPETVDASAYAHSVTDNDNLLSYAGMSLVLESNTVLRVFFRPTAGADLSGYTFTVDGEAVTPVQRGNLWYVELNNIAAKELDETHTFTAGDVTVEASALSYVNTVLGKADTMDAELVAVCKALFAYNETASAYFAAKN